jgi:hypothetical protein
MVEFNNALFKKNHKSFYSHQDIAILDECRTIVPSGITTKGWMISLRSISPKLYIRFVIHQRSTSLQRV